jgi:hypothetical protein
VSVCLTFFSLLLLPPSPSSSSSSSFFLLTGDANQKAYEQAKLKEEGFSLDQMRLRFWNMAQKKAGEPFDNPKAVVKEAGWTSDKVCLLFCSVVFGVL